MTMLWLNCLWCCHHISMHWWLDSGVLNILFWAKSLQCCPIKVQYLLSTIFVSLSPVMFIINSGCFYFVEISRSWMIQSSFLSKGGPSCGLWSVGRGCSVDRSGLGMHYMFCWDYEGWDSMIQIVLSDSVALYVAKGQRVFSKGRSSVFQTERTVRNYLRKGVSVILIVKGILKGKEKALTDIHSKRNTERIPVAILIGPGGI